MPSSMPQMRAFWAAVVWTGPSIGPPDPNCWPNAGLWEAVQQVRFGSPRGIIFPRFVLHAVGPVYRDGSQGESTILESCYRNALQVAKERNLRTIAFPCISTGVFGYPKEAACHLAVTTVLEWLMQHELPREVTFCCFEREDVRLYQLRVARIEQAAESE